MLRSRSPVCRTVCIVGCLRGERIRRCFTSSGQAVLHLDPTPTQLLSNCPGARPPSSGPLSSSGATAVMRARQGKGMVMFESSALTCLNVADPCQSQRLQPLGPLAPAWERIPPIGSRTGVILRSSLKAAEQRDEALRERLMRGLGERHHVAFSLPKDPLPKVRRVSHKKHVMKHLLLT